MTRQLCVALLLLAAAPCAMPTATRAQMPALNLIPDTPKDAAAEERRAKVDEAYRAAQKKSATPAPPTDPWGTVREPAKPAAPAPKKQAGAK